MNGTAGQNEPTAVRTVSHQTVFFPSGLVVDPAGSFASLSIKWIKTENNIIVLAANNELGVWRCRHSVSGVPRVACTFFKAAAAAAAICYWASRRGGYRCMPAAIVQVAPTSLPTLSRFIAFFFALLCCWCTRSETMHRHIVASVTLSCMVALLRRKNVGCRRRTFKISNNGFSLYGLCIATVIDQIFERADVAVVACATAADYVMRQKKTVEGGGGRRTIAGKP